MLLTINPQLFNLPQYEVPKSFANQENINRPVVSHLEDEDNYYLVLRKGRVPNPFFSYYESDDLFDGYRLELTKNRELVVYSSEDQFYTVEKLPLDSSADKISYKLYDQGTKLVIVISKVKPDSDVRSKSCKRIHVEDGNKAELEYQRQRKLQHEAQFKARKAAELQARKEAELRFAYEAQQRAQQEAELKARKEAQLKAKQEAELKARKEAQLKAKQEAELKARKEAELKARKETILKAKQEALLKAHQEAMIRATKEAELEALKEAEAEAQKEADLKKKFKQELKAKKLADLKAEKAEKKERERQQRLNEDVEEQRKRAEETLLSFFNGNPFGFVSSLPSSRENSTHSTSSSQTAEVPKKSVNNEKEKDTDSAFYGSQSMKNYTTGSRKPDFSPDYQYKEDDDLAMSDAEESKGQKYDTFDSFPSTPSTTAPNSPSLSSKIERSPTIEDLLDEEFL